jgi:hypothetical protein
VAARTESHYRPEVSAAPQPSTVVATETRDGSRPFGDLNLPAWFVPALTIGSLTPFLLGSLALVLRRAFAGGLIPPPMSVMLLLAASCAAMTTAARYLAPMVSCPWQRTVVPAGWVVAWVFLASAVTVPNTPLAGLAILWATVGGVIGMAYRGQLPRMLCSIFPLVRLGRRLAGWLLPSPAHANGSAEQATLTPLRPTSLRIVDPELASTEGSAELPLPAGVDQQLLRGVNELGVPYVSGKLRVVMTAHQRQACAHIMFCPPLEHSVDLEVDIIDGPDAEVTVGTILPQGARFDVRLGTTEDHAIELWLEYYGQAVPPEA